MSDTRDLQFSGRPRYYYLAPLFSRAMTFLLLAFLIRQQGRPTMAYLYGNDFFGSNVLEAVCYPHCFTCESSSCHHGMVDQQYFSEFGTRSDGICHQHDGRARKQMIHEKSIFDSKKTKFTILSPGVCVSPVPNYAVAYSVHGPPNLPPRVTLIW
jgi:hypothetical protein